MLRNVSAGELKELLLSEGASLVGVADISGLYASTENIGHPVGIAIAAAVPRDVILGISGGPTMDYYNAYHSINARLNRLAELCAGFIESKGYSAVAQTTDKVREFGVYTTAMPHKTVAVRGGLGWIGKCALLVTKQFGSAVRLTSVLTNAPLECDEPVERSFCGECSECAKNCPGGAVSGKLWTPGIGREELFSPLLCRKKARELAAGAINKEITLCGKCIECCPYTKKYLLEEN